MTPQMLRERLARFATDAANFAEPLLDRPKTRAGALQLISSSSSAAANHRAAGRGRLHSEFTSKISIALEEADESAHWLDYFQRLKIVHPDLDRLITESGELVAILTASVETAKANEEAAKNHRRHKRRKRPHDGESDDDPMTR